MSYETIKYEKEDGFCIITLNRPKSLNALSVQMWTELDHAVELVGSDDDIKAFIFTGAPRPDGRPCFCAGGDIKEMATFMSGGQFTKTDSAQSIARVPKAEHSIAKTLWSLRQPREPMVPTFEKIAWSPKISIAAIDGICTAGGIELALSCDIIIASETAQISDLHVKNLGWIGGAGATANMAWRVGVSKAIELCCTGDVIDGKEAHRIGLANQFWPPEQYLDKAKEMARKIGNMRAAALIMTKATCRSVWDMDRKSTQRYCDDGFSILLSEQEASDFGPQRKVKEL